MRLHRLTEQLTGCHSSEECHSPSQPRQANRGCAAAGTAPHYYRGRYFPTLVARRAANYRRDSERYLLRIQLHKQDRTFELQSVTKMVLGLRSLVLGLVSSDFALR